MIHSNKLTNKVVRNLLGGISQASLKRLTEKEDDFPLIEIIGRSRFVDMTAFCSWQSKKAGYLIKNPAQCMNSKDLMAYFGKSHTWIWQQIKTQSLPKPFKVGALNLWFENDIKNIPTKGA
jgi:predicted DNA-binding transcriptional regulator AlpA